MSTRESAFILFISFSGQEQLLLRETLNSNWLFFLLVYFVKKNIQVYII